MLKATSAPSITRRPNPVGQYIEVSVLPESAQQAPITSELPDSPLEYNHVFVDEEPAFQPDTDEPFVTIENGIININFAGLSNPNLTSDQFNEQIKVLSETLIQVICLDPTNIETIELVAEEKPDKEISNNSSSKKTIPIIQKYPRYKVIPSSGKRTHCNIEHDTTKGKLRLEQSIKVIQRSPTHVEAIVINPGTGIKCKGFFGVFHRILYTLDFNYVNGKWALDIPKLRAQKKPRGEKILRYEEKIYRTPGNFIWLVLNEATLNNTIPFFNKNMTKAFFLMTAYDGISLDSVLNKNNLFLFNILSLFDNVATAIEKFHTKKKHIHNDLNATNILQIIKDGSIKLIDYGLATEPGKVKGGHGLDIICTPESYLNGYRGNYSDDTFAFGVLLYQFLTKGLLPRESGKQDPNYYNHYGNIQPLEINQLCFLDHDKIKNEKLLIELCEFVNSIILQPPLERPNYIQIRDTMAKLKLMIVSENQNESDVVKTKEKKLGDQHSKTPATKSWRKDAKANPGNSPSTMYYRPNVTPTSRSLSSGSLFKLSNV